MQHITPEKQVRAKAELDLVFPGMTPEQITELNRARLKWSIDNPLASFTEPKIGTDSHPTTAARITRPEPTVTEPEEQL